VEEELENFRALFRPFSVSWILGSSSEKAPVQIRPYNKKVTISHPLIYSNLLTIKLMIKTTLLK
jgi:hypothetical protein